MGYLDASAVHSHRFFNAALACAKPTRDYSSGHLMRSASGTEFLKGMPDLIPVSRECARSTTALGWRLQHVCHKGLNQRRRVTGTKNSDGLGSSIVPPALP
jgi:hypothetical protein